MSSPAEAADQVFYLYDIKKDKKYLYICNIMIAECLSFEQSCCLT